MISAQGTFIKPIQKTLQFVFIPKSNVAWYDVVREGAEQAITEHKKREIQIQMNWDAPPEADVKLHTQIIEAHAKTRPDGLAVACLAPTTNSRSINNAVKEGVNVITFDTDAPNSLRKLYIGHANDYQDGYDLAVFLAEHIGARGKVAILSGTLTAPNHVGRVKGFKEGIAQYNMIEIVSSRPDGDNLETAVSLTEMVLKNHPDIKGFFCCNATNPIGCARAVKAAGKTDQVHIVGMDTLPETLEFIKEGVIDGIKMQRQWEIGYWAIEYMVAINQGHTVPEKHQIGSRLVVKDGL